MQLFYQPELVNGIYHLDPDESRHAIKVLRKTEGDEIQLIDGQGTFYWAKITEANQKKCAFEIVRMEKESVRSGFRHLAIAPTKNIDRIEWLVEKAVEIGIDRISFLHCKNSERKVIKLDRLERKAISAMKQSLKASKPILDELAHFNHFIQQEKADLKAIAYVDFDNPTELKDCIKKGQHTLVLIGPEGDFDQSEVELAMNLGYQKVSLGHSRLRTETAGIAAVHLMNIFS